MEKRLRVYVYVVFDVQSRLAANIIAPWTLDGLTL